MVFCSYAKVSDILPVCTACPTSEHERESAAARVLLGRLYVEARERCPSLPREMPELIRESGGKPRFAGGTAELSLSHDAGCVFAAIAVGEGEIGIDLVSLEREIPRTSEIAARFFSEGERSALLLREPEERREEFLRIWARKEAAVKASGEGAAALRRTDTSREALGARSLSEANGAGVLFEDEITLGGRRFFAVIYKKG